MYEEFKLLPPPPEKLEAEPEESSNKYQRRRRMRDKFERLMSYTDDEIRLLGSNERILFSQYGLYTESNSAIKDAIKHRTLSRKEYHQRRKEIFDMHDRVSLDVRFVDLVKLRNYADHSLSVNKPLQRSVRDWEGFKGYVFDLLSGKELSPKKLRIEGLHSEMIVARARNIFSRFRMEEAERDRALRNPELEELSINLMKGGTNPIAFEEGWQKRRD